VANLKDWLTINHDISEERAYRWHLATNTIYNHSRRAYRSTVVYMEEQLRQLVGSSIVSLWCWVLIGFVLQLFNYSIHSFVLNLIHLYLWIMLTGLNYTYITYTMSPMLDMHIYTNSLKYHVVMRVRDMHIIHQFLWIPCIPCSDATCTDNYVTDAWHAHIHQFTWIPCSDASARHAHNTPILRNRHAQTTRQLCHRFTWISCSDARHAHNTQILMNTM
jgi:hypothetical protein